MPKAIQLQIDVALQALSPQEAQKWFVTVAKITRDELIEDGRAGQTYTTIVDGSRTTPLDRAQTHITFQWQYLEEATQYALAELVKRAKYGQFTGKFWLSVEDQYYAPGSYNASVSRGAKQVVIGNTEAWDRKLDVQLMGSKRINYSVLPGLYQDVARKVNSRFGGSIEAKRVYDYSFPGRYQPKHPINFQSPALLISLPR